MCMEAPQTSAAANPVDTLEGPQGSRVLPESHLNTQEVLKNGAVSGTQKRGLYKEPLRLLSIPFKKS